MRKLYYRWLYLKRRASRSLRRGDGNRPRRRPAYVVHRTRQRLYGLRPLWVFTVIVLIALVLSYVIGTGGGFFRSGIGR